MLNRFIAYIERTELYWFWGIAVLSTFPILLHHYFPTLDGPAHLYNAHITWELISQDTFFGNYFQFHPVPVPNWISNLFFLPLCQLLPAYLAEKTVLLLYVLSFPFSFRYLVRSLNGVPLSSFLIFPFTYSNMFMNGFYNFSFGVLFCFLSLGYFFNHVNQITFKKGLWLCILQLLVYFSHVFTAAYCAGIMLLYPLVNHFLSSEKKSLRITSKICLQTFTIVLPSLALCAIFSRLQPSSPHYYSIAPLELLEWLCSIRPLIAHKADLEGIFTKLILGVLLVHLAIGMWLSRNTFFQKTSRPYIFAVATGLLLLIFILPDGDGWAGYISIRTMYLFFLFGILGLSLLKLPSKVMVPLFLLVMVVHVLLLARKNASQESKQYLFSEISQIADSVDAYSIVSPVDLSEDYRIGHISNYIGVIKPAIIADNYEASTGYFPILWNKDVPSFRVGTLSAGMANIQGVITDNKHYKNSDYVLLMGSKSQIERNGSEELFEQLQNSYYLKMQTDNFVLYKLRSNANHP